MAYETLSGLGRGTYEFAAMQEADRRRVEELRAILANPTSRVVLFANWDRVDVWSVGDLIPTVKALLKIVFPGQRLEVIAYDTLLNVGRGEHSVEELLDEEFNSGLSVHQR